METAIAWLGLSRGAVNVLRQIGLSVFGVDERYRRVGVPLAERVLATALQRSTSGVHEAVTELLQKGVPVVRASELAKMLEADRLEVARLEAERELAGRLERGSEVVLRWAGLRELAMAQGFDIAEVEAAIGRIGEGNLLELEVAEVLVGLMETDIQLADVRRPAPIMVPAAPIMVPAAEPVLEVPVSAELEPCPPSDMVSPPILAPVFVLPTGIARRKPRKDAPAPQPPGDPQELRERAATLLSRLVTAMEQGEGEVSAANRLIGQAAIEHLRLRLGAGNDAMLGLAVRLAEGMVGRFGASTAEDGIASLKIVDAG